MIIKRSNTVLLGFISAYFILGILQLNKNIVVSEKLFAALGVSTLFISLAEILNSLNKLIEKIKNQIKFLKALKKINEIIIIWLYIVAICILILYPFIKIKFNGQISNYGKIANTCTFFSTALLFLSLFLNELEIEVKELNEEIRNNNKIIEILDNKRKDI
ncbi:hypothetical protein [Clostridium thermobutyricum]|uniref:hypothetical protein n=1 Tax=Clostridium thermobutyricum TaxID=29372 RepID=UPI002942B3F0|nr:hypothetical protein [Clostridium thermobutyricum]